jgi:trehalose-6-phosphatase
MPKLNSFGGLRNSLVVVALTKALRWESLADELDFSWKDRARKLLRMYTDRVHGTYIQEKACSLVWHYADCDQDWGAMQVTPNA